MKRKIIYVIILSAVLSGAAVMMFGCARQNDISIGREREAASVSKEPEDNGGEAVLPTNTPDDGEFGFQPGEPPADVPKDWNRPEGDGRERPEERQGGNRPEMPEGGKMPEFPQPFSDGRGGDVTYTPLIFDREGLFSDRDMEAQPDISEATYIRAKDSEIYTIDAAGIYVLSGEAKDFSVMVDAAPKDKVQIVLEGARIQNSDFPVIYAKEADKCFITLSGDNELAVSGTFRSDGEVNTDAVIFARCDLTLNGDGNLTVRSECGNGITSKDDLRITGGAFTVVSGNHGIEANDSVSIADGTFTIDAGKDGIHCANDEQEGFIYLAGGIFRIDAVSDGIQATSYLVADGGEYRITASEGLEATYVQVNGGSISIQASDDGVNAASKSREYDVVIEINGGELTIVMGPGDTDGLDANGLIAVNGGTIDVKGGSTFDYDRGAVYTGGTIIVNGETVDTIPEPTMGGGGGRGQGRVRPR